MASDALEEDLLTPEMNIDKKESMLHRLDSLSLLIYCFLLTLTVLSIWLLKHRRFRYLHETGLAIIYGLVIGLIIRYGMNNVGDDVSSLKVVSENPDAISNATTHGPPDLLLIDIPGMDNHSDEVKTLSYSFKGEVKKHEKLLNELDQKTTFDPEIFFNVLLPPIIFHAGYSMKKRFFFRNIGSILTFAFFGTAISTFVIGGIMYGVTRVLEVAEIFSWTDSLHFGAMISATDPVTVLALFNDLHVDVNLYALVFGESVLNDAVAMVMTRTLEDYEEDVSLGVEQPAYLVLLTSLGEFLGIFAGSFLVGSLIACTTALLTKFTHIRNHPQLESTLFVIMSYSAFLICEVLNLTGIVAVLFCGICQAHYTYNNLSPESRAITRNFFDQLNFMAENFIFSYIGVAVFTFPNHRFDAGFIIGSFFAIIVGRAFNIYILSFFLNLGRKTKITMNLQHMLFLSGLRGAIAFALSIRNTLTYARQMILTTTLIIVVCTVLFCGGSVVTLLTWLRIPCGVDDDDENIPISSPSNRYVQHGEGGVAANGRQPGDDNRPVVGEVAEKSWLAMLWSGFDDKYLKPLLTHSNPTLMETLPGCCLPVARFFTSAEQLSKHPAMQISREDSNTLYDDNISQQMAADDSEAAGAGGPSAVTVQPDGKDGAERTLLSE